MQLIVFVRNIVLGESDESKESNESHGTEESDGSDESNGSEESKESDGSVGSDECRDVSTLYKGRAGLLTRVGFFLRRTSMPQQRAATRAYTCPPDRMPLRIDRTFRQVDAFWTLSTIPILFEGV